MTLIQPPQSMTLSRQQMVSLLGMTESGFSRAQARLEDNDFPPKLPGISKWSRPAVVAWIKANGDTDLMNRILIGDPPHEPEDVEQPIPDIASELAARYGGGGAGIAGKTSDGGGWNGGSAA